MMKKYPLTFFLSFFFLLPTWLGLCSGAYAHCGVENPARIVPVRTAMDLHRALRKPLPGDVILVDKGVYVGNFVIKERSGTQQAPITICGTRESILEGRGTSLRYVLYLYRSANWKISGITVRKGKKGIVLDEVVHSVIENVTVHEIGEEGIHFRKNSSDNTLRESFIYDTGRISPGLGEGVYIGSSISNFKNDQSNNNLIVGNRIGPGVTAECIDIKEYTQGGKILENVFDGTSMTGVNYSDSWVDVKGNDYLIAGNRGVHSLKDGFQTHAIVPGWGINNVFEGNILDVQGEGYGIFIDSGGGNIVKCSNKVMNAQMGLTNIKCQGPP